MAYALTHDTLTRIANVITSVEENTSVEATFEVKVLNLSGNTIGRIGFDDDGVLGFIVDETLDTP